MLIYIYRATLCVSAVLAIARCSSVCLSVTLVDCIQMAKVLVKLLFVVCTRGFTGLGV